MANFLNSTHKKKTTPPARQNSIQINSSSTIATNNALAQQQIANLQLASQIEQAQLQAQLHQQNAAVQNTALNNLAAALNLSIQPQITQTTHNQAAATAALFQQNPFGRPYLPIFSFTSPWQYAAAAAALQPLPDRCIIQPAIQPVHVFQQPTVNVVVKPQTSVPVFSSHHHSHKTSHKAQKNDEVKITLNHSSPSKQSINSFHKSTSAPVIGVTTSSLHSSSSYQVKIKTEKQQRSNTNYENTSLPETSYLQNHPSPQSLLTMTDDQQLFHLQQRANNFLLPNSTYFSKIYQNPKITSQQPIEAIKIQTQQSSINSYQKKNHSIDSKTKLRKEDQKQKIKIEKKEEIIEIDDNPEITENTILKTSEIQNNDDCTIISCSSNSSSNKDQQHQKEQNIPETTILKPCSNINTNLNVNITSLSPSSSSSTMYHIVATNNNVTINYMYHIVNSHSKRCDTEIHQFRCILVCGLRIYTHFYTKMTF
jgi:hypothetical protein